jgi:hypothetical protein
MLQGMGEAALRCRVFIPILGGIMAMLQERERLHHRQTIESDPSHSRRAVARLAIAALVLGWAALGARPGLAQDDDWQEVHESAPAQTAPAQAAAPAPRAEPQEAQPAADGARMVCGEMARPAAEPYKSILANINREWGTDVPLYESVRADSPHVSRAGCIFYNPTFMEVFLRGETDEHGEPDKTSMIYAILAHELGHIEHHDYARAEVSSVDKELEADRFSGYTLEEMGIARDNITPFYSMGGDEFSGVHDHGFSNERISAFDTGWKRAEWKAPEAGPSTARNTANSAAPDDSSGAADDASVAAVP